jgi:hypothetical protein
VSYTDLDSPFNSLYNRELTDMLRGRDEDQQRPVVDAEMLVRFRNEMGKLGTKQEQYEWVTLCGYKVSLQLCSIFLR